MKVANRKTIRRLGIRSLKAARTRNLVAVVAIALTTILFTSLFTIATSIGYAIQQSNFRQAGSYAHGSFKYLTGEQYEELKDDPLIAERGKRQFIGMPAGEPFTKAHVEVSWCDENEAKWMFISPKEGRLPKEGTNEAATDTRVLSLLGVEPEIGAEFTMTFPVDGKETTETFTLCGWWEYDSAIVASHVLLPESRAVSILEKLDTKGKDGMTGFYSMDVMFKNAFNIENDLIAILERHGYQNEGLSAGDNYIRIGVNWGYLSTNVSEGLEPGTIAAAAGILLLIIFTGYLIIYNVFHISVSNDIRFYGLLKTIGTTGRQIRRIIRIQALALSAAGIPAGLLAGYVLGAALTPVVMNELDGLAYKTLSASPLIFIGSAVFALFTVIISCRKPGKLASKVSPVEAVRYTESDPHKKKAVRRSKGGASLAKMARANLGRNKSRTVVTILSMSLAVVLFHATVLFTGGFDMDKYVSRNIKTDFVVANADYFQAGAGFWSADRALPEEMIREIENAGSITEGGRIYGKCSSIDEFVEEDYYRQKYAKWTGPDELDDMVKNAEKNGAGLIEERVQLYGMEPFVLDQLTVAEGSIDSLYKDGTDEIAAVYLEDDYGNPETDSNWAKVGDTVTLRYVEEYEYYDPDTGEILDPDTVDMDRAVAERVLKYQDREYRVAALVVVPHSLSYRYYGADEFVMNAQTFTRDTGTDAVMLYAYNTTEEDNAHMEGFLKDFTEHKMPQTDYESKETFKADFESMRGMFLLLGGALSLIVGLVGILNFLNAVLTGILTRRREFAVLQSIGMTGKQLKAMLIWEGLYYAAGAILISTLIGLVAGPAVGSAAEGMFWFFTYKFTILPVLCVAPFFAALGILLPLFMYHSVSKRSVVERLREAES